MGLAMNNCRKHGGHVEDECPKCVADEYEKALDLMREFFETHGKSTVVLKTVNGSKETIPVEGLFQYFRMRIIHELSETGS
jgi:hypothetical protein